MIQVLRNDAWVTCDPTLTWEDARKLWPDCMRRQVNVAAWERQFECVERITELVPIEREMIGDVFTGVWTPWGWCAEQEMTMRNVAQASPTGRMLGAAFAELMMPSGPGRTARVEAAAFAALTEHTKDTLARRKPWKKS